MKLSHVSIQGGILLVLSVLASAAAAQAPVFHDEEARANMGADRLMVQLSDGANSTSSSTYTNLTQDNITIPAGQEGFVVVTVSGETLCTGGSGWCTLRVLIDGVEARPDVGSEFAFDSPSDSYESHSIQRISNLLGPGSHSVAVEYAVNGATTFRIDDWIVTAEYWQKN